MPRAARSESAKQSALKIAGPTGFDLKPAVPRPRPNALSLPMRWCPVL